MIAILNAQIVLPHEILSDGVLLIDGKRIVSVLQKNEEKIPENADIYDAHGLYVGPGFVDIHVHGGNGYYWYQNPTLTGNYFLKHGVTTALAALYIDLDKYGYLEAIRRIKTAIKQGDCKNLAGLYMEGPYINPKYGSMAELNKWRGDIHEDDYKELVEETGSDAKIWVIAPERDGIFPFLKKVKSVYPQATVSVGHSEATPEQIHAIKKYGLILQTHCTNATGQVETLPGTRSCGPDEACLMDRDMYAEVICDSLGIHVHPDMLKLILAVKGVDRTILISDSMPSTVPNPPSLSHIPDLSYDEAGSLCGSKLTMDTVCRNMIKHTECSISDVFIMASRNPARVIGMDGEIGSISVGKKANLVFLNSEFHVENVMLEGCFVNNQNN